MAQTILFEKYKSEVIKGLMDKFGYKNIMEVPKLEKVVINMGVGEAKDNSKLLDSAVSELEAITGQKPIVTKSKKSVANFKIREGMPIGTKVTLRGDKMIVPEIEFDKVDKTSGMDIIFVTTAKTDEEARELLSLMGMPFAK